MFRTATEMPAFAGMTNDMKVFHCFFPFLCLLATIAHAEIVIGVAGPMTGASAAFGLQMQHGVQSAIDDINAQGGISGQALTLQTADDSCDNRQAETAAQSLIRSKVAVVIGHFCSYPALAAARLYETSGITMITPSASLPALTEAGLSNVIRIASRDDAQGDVAAARIAKDYPTGVVAVLSDGAAAHVALANRFTANLGKAPALAQSFRPDAPDFDALISEIKARKIDVIYFACEASDAGRIAADLQTAGLKAALFGAEPLLTDLYWEKAGDAGEATHVTFAADPQSSRAARALIAALKAKGFDADGPTLASYAALQLFAAAAQGTGMQNGRAISQYLHSGKSVPTVLGDMRFDKNGDSLAPHFVWYQWSSGAYRAESSGN